jgi:transcriptional regulator GlxA family with amidase domain
MNYLRGVRLRHTHDDLLAADPTTTTVAEIAARWGFGHMGRFSAEYHRHHGEYPKATLRR